MFEKRMIGYKYLEEIGVGKTLSETNNVVFGVTSRIEGNNKIYKYTLEQLKWNSAENTKNTIEQIRLNELEIY